MNTEINEKDFIVAIKLFEDYNGNHTAEDFRKAESILIQQHKNIRKLIGQFNEKVGIIKELEKTNQKNTDNLQIIVDLFEENRNLKHQNEEKSQKIEELKQAKHDLNQKNADNLQKIADLENENENVNKQNILKLRKIADLQQINRDLNQQNMECLRTIAALHEANGNLNQQNMENLRNFRELQHMNFDLKEQSVENLRTIGDLQKNSSSFHILAFIIFIVSLIFNIYQHYKINRSQSTHSCCMNSCSMN